jgi:uncharacterized protein
MRVVMSGGTGFIGRHLALRLESRGDEIIVLTRSGRLPPELAETRVRALSWDAVSGGEWQKSVDGADAIIHLAGDQAVGTRFTAGRKARILTSRVTSAERLVEAVAAAANKPRAFLSAGGVSYYGGREDAQPLDESAPAGNDFLAEVCQKWEGAVRGAERYGVRVAIARMGVVFGPGIHTLEVMSRPFKFLIGGPLARGRQYFPWVHLEDVLRAYLLLLDDESCRGPFNLVAPETPPEAEVARALGKVLRRPSWIPAPSFALKLLFGEGAVPLLTGQNVVPRALREHGFEWKFGELGAALEDCLAPAK